jgi:hypothetical protein
VRVLDHRLVNRLAPMPGALSISHGIRSPPNRLPLPCVRPMTAEVSPESAGVRPGGAGE